MSSMSARLRELLQEYPMTALPTHDLRFMEDVVTTMEAAEAKLAAIDALHRGEYDVDPDSFTMGQKFCVTDDEEWPCPTHRILHPKEGL